VQMVSMEQGNVHSVGMGPGHAGWENGGVGVGGGRESINL